MTVVAGDSTVSAVSGSARERFDLIIDLFPHGVGVGFMGCRSMFMSVVIIV